MYILLKYKSLYISRYLNKDININKNKLGGMKLEYDRKLQKAGGSLSSSLPSVVRETLELKEGGTIRYIVDLEKRPPVVYIENPEKK